MTKSVFIIGAGASLDFGLPSGEQLVGDISSLFAEFQKAWKKNQPMLPSQRRLKKESPSDTVLALDRVLGDIAHDPGNTLFEPDDFNLIPKLTSSIWLAKSIDTFIDQQREPAISFLGKMAIVLSILESEGEIKKRDKEEMRNRPVSLVPSQETGKRRFSLDFQKLRNTWLVPLFRELTSNSTVDDLETRLESTSLIIFNYDRCIEHFLYYALISYYRIHPADAAKLIKKITIIHYGRLGALPWQNTFDSELVIDYGDTDLIEKIPPAANRIRTFAEAPSKKIVEKTRDEVRAASILVFLGFGYHLQNMEILGLGESMFGDLPSTRTIFATGFGLSDYRREKVSKMLGQFATEKKITPSENIGSFGQRNLSRLSSRIWRRVLCRDRNDLVNRSWLIPPDQLHKSSLKRGIVQQPIPRYGEAMPRYAFKIEYDGRPFAGWQRQKGQMSVQQAIEEALRKLEPDAPAITGAGRTDSGVHALGQVVHCDLRKDWQPFRLSEALNYHLKPLPVAILAAAVAPQDFNARFSATSRAYRFRLISRRAPATHDKGLVWQIAHDLELEPMQAAAQHLLGKHDFTTFRSTVCQADSPVKTLDELRIERFAIPHGHEFRFHVRARSFLHNQVRSFVGTLERVGAGSMAPADVLSALNARNRAACGPVSPPQGLYLAHVGYPDDLFSG